MGLQNSETLLYPSYDHIMLSITQDSSGVAPTITAQSGGAIARSAVTLTRNSAGNYTLAVTDFQRARSLGQIQCTISSTAAGMVSATGPTYSGTTASYTVLTFNSSAVATDFTTNVDLVSF